MIASMYVPNGGKNYPAKIEFLMRLTEWVRQLQADGRDVLLCGDVNIARTEMDVHPKERKPGTVGQLPEERALFEALLGTWLSDVGRAMDPDNANLFTWWAPWRSLRARNIGWRLDYLLASPGVATRARSLLVQADVGDQRPCSGDDDDHRLHWRASMPSRTPSCAPGTAPPPASTASSPTAQSLAGVALPGFPGRRSRLCPDETLTRRQSARTSAMIAAE